MATEKRFESRFEGPNNKGLRAKIRRAVAKESSNPARAAAVRRLVNDVAFMGAGRAILEQVACDYERAQKPGGPI